MRAVGAPWRALVSEVADVSEGVSGSVFAVSGVGAGAGLRKKNPMAMKRSMPPPRTMYF